MATARIEPKWNLAEALAGMVRPTELRIDPAANGNEAALTEVLRVITTFNQTGERPSPERLDILLRVDESCQTLFNDYRLECLSHPGSSRVTAGETWADLENAYRQLGRAYQKFIISYHDDPENSPATAQIATLTARAIHCFANVAKIGFFHTQPLDGKTWKLLHKLYRFAESQAFESRQVALYGRPERIETSCRDLYVRMLMLATLNTGGLTPKQLEVADDWLTEWVPGVSLSQEYRPGECLYFVHLGEEDGARRTHEASMDLMCRYLNTDWLCVQIDRTRQSFRDGEVSAMLGLRADFRGVEYMELLERLDRIWSPSVIGSDQRTYRRVQADSTTVEVVRGLADMCRAAKREFETDHGMQTEGGTLSAAEELDLKIYGFITERTKSKKRDMLSTQELLKGVESWKLHDQSVNGYGAIIPVLQDNGLRVGTLLGVRVHGQKRWAVGAVVRKLNLRDSGEIFVGVELLSLTPVIVAIEPAIRDLAVTSPLSIPASKDNQWALFLPGDKAAGRADSLLIDATMYATGKKFNLSARNVAYTVVMNRVIKKGEGWQRVGFEVLAKKT